MIPNLNFYDIYGYLLPGLTLLSLTWLPFGLTSGHSPSEKLSSLSSALIATVVAYIVGHLLRVISIYSLPSDIEDEFGRRRSPSDRMLDADDTTFSTHLKQKLGSRIKELFDIDVKIGLRRRDVVKAVSTSRTEAFLLCRSSLLQSKRGLYGEQFEGMYTLMRGLTAAFGLGCCFHLGWTASDLPADRLKQAVFVVMLAYFVWVCVVVIRHRIGSARFPNELMPALLLLILLWRGVEFAGVNNWRWTAVGFWVLTATLVSMALPDWWRNNQIRQTLAWVKVFPVMLAMLLLGSALGSHYRPGIESRGFLLLAISLEVFVAVKCYFSYKQFAEEFAKAIYRDFASASLVKFGKPGD